MDREPRGALCLQLGAEAAVWLRHTLNRAAFDSQTGCWPISDYPALRQRLGSGSVEIRIFRRLPGALIATQTASH